MRCATCDRNQYPRFMSSPPSCSSPSLFTFKTTSIDSRPNTLPLYLPYCQFPAVFPDHPVCLLSPAYKALTPSCLKMPLSVAQGPPYLWPLGAIRRVRSTSKGKHTIVAVMPAHTNSKSNDHFQPGSLVMLEGSTLFDTKSQNPLPCKTPQDKPFRRDHRVSTACHATLQHLTFLIVHT